MTDCGCWTCSQEYVEIAPGLALPIRFIVCPTCGNKRCPRATHHDNQCSGSNDPGQPGSRFEHWPHPDRVTTEGEHDDQHDPA